MKSNRIARGRRHATRPSTFVGAVAGLLVGLGLALAGAGPARAGDAASENFVGIVELFTSQGCANCPPADRLLSRLAKRDGIVALSYHVDYWDYIGWKDTLATRQNAERQRAYGKTFKSGSMFTPQMVVNGTVDLAGADEARIEASLKASTLGTKAQVRLTQDGDTLHVVAKSAGTPPGEQAPVLMLVTYRDETLTQVARGENQGRHLRNTHAVLDWRILATAGARRVEIDLPVSTLTVADGGRTGCAAFLQKVRPDGAPGAIIAAAMLEIEQ